MTIEELLAATGLTDNDLVAIWDADAASNVEPTQKITAAQFAAAVKTLASLLGTGDVVNNLSNGSTNPVSSGGVYTAFENKISSASIKINRSNLLTFTYEGLNAITDSAIFKHGLLIYGAGSDQCGIAFVFVNTNGAVTITNMSGSGRTFTGQVTNGNLVITANSAVYGGLKLIWLT